MMALYQIAFCQEPMVERLSFSEWAESYLPNQSDNLSEEALDNLYQFFQHPLNLNTATTEELAALLILTKEEIQTLLNHRDLSGGFVSLYELQAVFSRETYQKLLPLVQVTPAGAWPTEGRGSLVLRYDRTIETRRGFSTGKYIGQPFRVFARGRFALQKNTSIGFTAEKDPGEAFRSTFASFHASVQVTDKIRVVLGDFQPQFGQGLVLAGGFFLGKGAETILAVRRSSLGIRPYVSATEFGFFRGIAITIQLHPRWAFTGFVSGKKRDANLLNDSTVSSLQTSGLHRTTSEILDKNSLRSTDIGGVLAYQKGSFRLGLITVFTQYDKILKKANRAYNQYEFSGKEHLVTGLEYAFSWRNYTAFGEVARSTSGGVGIVSGVLKPLSKRWDASAVFRYYARDFHSFYGNAFGENSRNINETGGYLGLKFTPNKRWLWTAYTDIFAFPAPKYLVDTPSKGYGFLLRGIFQPEKSTRYSAQFFHEKKEKNVPGRLTKFDIVRPVRRSGFAFSHQKKIGSRLETHTRLFYTSYTYDGFSVSQGVTLAQELHLKLTRIQVQGQVAYFQTDDYDSRIYVFEQDVPSAFSIPAYASEGVRGYALVRVPINQNTTGWIRFSRIHYFDEQTVGSGLDEINRPHKTDIRIQLRWQF